MDRINVRLYDTLGCTVVATVLLQSLREKLPVAEINVFTSFPDLLVGLQDVNTVVDANIHTLNHYDVDLTGYLEVRKPQESKPYRHLAVHMLEVAEEQLDSKVVGSLRRDFVPAVNLTVQEQQNARELVRSLSHGKPVVWLQTKTRLSKKDWPREGWNEVTRKMLDHCTFIDLSLAGYERRTSIAITKFCTAGVTLDTFLLHGSKAVGARNVFALMVSSHPEVVTYTDQDVLDGLGNPQSITPENVVQRLKRVLG